MKSMTGMGRAAGMVLKYSLRLEIKSVNHRFCEISVRTPSRFSALEIPIRNSLRARLGRGKIDVQLVEDRSASITDSDIKALHACHDYLTGIKNELGIKQDITIDQVMNGLGQWVSQDYSLDEMWAGLAPLVDQAITELEKMRLDEGLRLKVDILARFQKIAVLVQSLAALSTQIASEMSLKIRERLQEKLQGLAENLDENRLAQEVVYYLDRMEVTEEIKRLESHLHLAFQLLESKEPVGRKMDFLLQEIQRELNTLSNKSQSTNVSHVAVEAKVELEKIREQIQNIE